MKASMFEIVEKNLVKKRSNFFLLDAVQGSSVVREHAQESQRRKSPLPWNNFGNKGVHVGKFCKLSKTQTTLSKCGISLVNS